MKGSGRVKLGYIPPSLSVVIYHGEKRCVMCLRLFESVCPWADLPYEEQLRRKEIAMKNALKQMSFYLSKRGTVPVSYWVGPRVTRGRAGGLHVQSGNYIM